MPKNEVLSTAAASEQTDTADQASKKPRLAQELEATSETMSFTSEPNTLQEKIIKTDDMLRNLEEQWAKEVNVFVQLNVKCATELTQVNWLPLTDSLTSSIDKRIALISNFDDADLDQPIGIFEKYDLKRIIHLKYALQGIKNIITGNNDQAIKNFRKALEVNSDSMLTWLWLMDAYYRSNKHLEACEAFETIKDQVNQPFNPIPVNSLYPFLSMLDESCIVNNFLQYTHTSYNISEIIYSYKKSLALLDRTTTNTQLSYFENRGDACFANGHYNEAIINYNLALKGSNNFNIHYHIALCFALANQCDKAMDSLDVAINLSSIADNKAEIYLIAIELCLKLQDEGKFRFYINEASQFFLLNEKEIKPANYINLLIHTTKGLLIDKIPELRMVNKNLNLIVINYKKLNFTERDRSNLFEEFSQLILDFYHIYQNNGLPDNAKNILDFYLSTYEELLSEVEEEVVDSDEENIPGTIRRKMFFTWCHERVYLSYFTTLISNCTFLFLNNDNELFGLDTSRIESIINKIPIKLTSYRINIDPNASGASLYNLFDSISTWIALDNSATIPTRLRSQLEPLFPGYCDIASPLHSSPDDIMQVDGDEPKTDIQTSMKSIYNDANLLADQNLSLKHTHSLTQRYHETLALYKYASIKASGHINTFFLKLYQLFEKATTQSVTNLSIDELVILLDSLLTNLNEYRELIKSENNKIVMNSHLSNLIHRELFIFPTLCKRLLFISAELIAIKQDEKAKIALKFVEDFISKLHDFELSHLNFRPTMITHHYKLREQINKRHMELNAQIEQNRSHREHSASSKNSPLSIEYGDINKPYIVPFPKEIMTEGLRGFQNESNIAPTKNLSEHMLTIVFKSSNSTTRAHIHLTLSSRNELLGFEITKNNYQSILNRIQRGWDLHAKNSDNMHFEVSTRPEVFNDVQHKHSEQHFYQWLSQQPLASILDGFKKSPGGKALVPGSKIYMVSFETASLRTSCHCCRLSALATQLHSDEFIVRFEKYLLDNGYKLPKASPNVPRLKSTTRILAHQENGVDRHNGRSLTHSNPSITNVKILRNLGIFQVNQAGIFVSGSAAYARGYNK